jgi:hypothetical protein
MPLSRKPISAIFDTSLQKENGLNEQAVFSVSIILFTLPALYGKINSVNIFYL